jgi:hypothetical protein
MNLVVDTNTDVLRSYAFSNLHIKNKLDFLLMRVLQAQVGELPNDAEWIAGQIGMNAMALEPLIEAGLVRIGEELKVVKPGKALAVAVPDWKDDDELRAFRMIYPKRLGSNSWPKALKAMRARLKEGYTIDEIFAGARRYADYIRSDQKEGTVYVMQAATFLGPDLHFQTDFGRARPVMTRVEQAAESARASILQDNRSMFDQITDPRLPKSQEGFVTLDQEGMIL